MEERTTGLILRTRPLTETSLIVQWLTRDAGRISTVAKGARRPKSAFRGKLDLFFTAELSFTRSRRSDLHALREVRLLDTLPALRRDLDLLQQASYAARFIERATETDTPIPEIYELATAFLSLLGSRPAKAETVLWFELKLLDLLGLQPDPDRAGVSPRTRKLLAEVSSAAWPALAELQPDPGQIKELDHFLHGFLIYHFDRLPTGRAAAVTPKGVGS